jgi:glucosylceramidase
LNNNVFWDVFYQLFDPIVGIGMSYIRLPISACDFSLSNFTYDNQPSGQVDPQLADFSISHDENYTIPLIQQIQQKYPGVQIIASPWSAPAWMKTTDSLLGTVNNVAGTLIGEFYQSYANYFVDFIQDYAEQGIKINALTVQNEPLYAPTGYPGMSMDQNTQSDFINNYLAPTFLTHGITTQVMVYDHNWDMESYPAYVLGNLNNNAQKVVHGAAFHCYGGEVSNQTTLHNQFPNQHIYMTECSGGGWAPDWASAFVSDMQTLFIGNVNNWGEVGLKWNIALDQNEGPQNGGCSDCRPMVTINTDNNQVTYNEDFYSIGMMSKYVPSGSVVIETSINNQNLMAAGFITPSGSYSLIVLNQGGDTENFSVSLNGQYFTASLATQTAGAYTWTN